ncbi:MAG: methionine--tRNA ligase [Oligosphaeraceae bacterium]
MSDANFYLTTPIYYVNDKPHIGHAYTTILGDVLSRCHRLLGEPVHFLTGTDEHGQKVEQAARKNGTDPLSHCDTYVKRFQDLWKRLNISNDDFIRTTQPRHVVVVQKILQDLWDKGLIYQSEYEGNYCVGCERYFTDKDLKDGCCPDCGRKVDTLVEKNYFFRMSAYQQRLIDYINANPDFIRPANRRQETLGFLKQPLDDLCISRSKTRLNWGIELPFDHDYVTYVWFDALVNYISAVGYLADDQAFQTWWPANFHLIGKDILTTHTVYWPTMLMAMGLPLPKTVFAHGWWLLADQKMSKSVGNVVNPMDMADKYGVDALRYFLMAAMSLGQDANFSEEAFVTRYNADLANNLGNLLSRMCTMVAKNLQGSLPPAHEPRQEEKEMVDACQNAVAAWEAAIRNMQLDRGLAEIMGAVAATNRYFDAMKPWTMAKAGDLEGLGRVLRHTAEALRVVSGLLYPVMPTKMAELRQAIGIPAEEVVPTMKNLGHWNLLAEGAQVQPIPGSLFPRIKWEPPQA